MRNQATVGHNASTTTAHDDHDYGYEKLGTRRGALKNLRYRVMQAFHGAAWIFPSRRQTEAPASTATRASRQPWVVCSCSRQYVRETRAERYGAESVCSRSRSRSPPNGGRGAHHRVVLVHRSHGEPELPFLRHDRLFERSPTGVLQGHRACLHSRSEQSGKIHAPMRRKDRPVFRYAGKSSQPFFVS